MNERIKLLAEESGAWEYFNEGNEKSAVMDSKALSNFAELIIEECINIANENDETWHGSGVMIREHFGVK